MVEIHPLSMDTDSRQGEMAYRFRKYLGIGILDLIWHLDFVI